MTTTTTAPSTARGTRNAWLPWKRVRRESAPPNTAGLATVTGRSGVLGILGVSPDGPYPALYLDLIDPVANENIDTLRVGLSGLVDSLVAANDRDADRWDPLVEVDMPDNPDARGTGDDRLFGNRLLTAHRHGQPDGTVVLSYHWRDRAPIRDWRVGMRVKNELAGPEWEAVELYPAESRLMDEANEYWLIAFPPDHPGHAAVASLGHPERATLTVDDHDAIDPEGAASQRDDDGTVVR